MQRKRITALLVSLLSVLLVFALVACTQSGDANNAGSASANPSAGDAAEDVEVPEDIIVSDTDYSDMNNWVYFESAPQKEVDIFVVYPTLTQSEDEADRPYVRIDSAMMLEAASGWLAENEAIFAKEANIYAPLYRQLNGVELGGLNNETFESYTNATPRDDVFKAFDYFLTHVNKGERPFILFSHSQGTQLTIELSTTFLGNERYRQYNENLIVTYAIGCSITQSQIDKNPALGFSKSSNDTGVIVSWNTTASSEVESGAYLNFGTWKSGALMTNPITWTTEETPAPAEQNGASMVTRDDGTIEMVKAYADAVVDNEHNVLVTTTVDESNFEAAGGVTSMFHGSDIAFFYESIQRNLQERIAAYTAKDK